MLQFDNVSLRRGPHLLFARATFQIHPGQKVGLTGANGTGKSSLFAMILGRLGSDSGEVRRPAGWQIAHVAQEMPASAQPAIEFVLDGDTGLRRLQRDLADAEAAGDGERIAHLHAELEHVGGYQANSRAASLLSGLGFAPGDETRPVGDFSGGWRMRLNLAQALMCRSDLLLLDEPTNHLDLDAVIWLEAWLRQYRGTLLLISHDRDFLDSVCGQILHIEHHRATLYSGNYSAFERVRAEQLANQQAAFQKQQREIAHMHAFVERFRAKATKARQAQSRIKALERMELIAPAHVDSPFRFAFREPAKNPHPLLTLDHCAAGYADTRVIDGVRLVFNPGDRVGLLGPNGAGKSTLIKLLAGELAPLAGECSPAKHLAIGYFAQHQLEQLHPAHSPLEHLQQLDPQASEQALRDYLGGFGFVGDKALEAVAPFSGGEKSRLVLALLIYRRPNLLLLDEPTNHLDLEMRQALATALQDFAGAMVLVSHDRHLLRVSCDRLLLVHGGRVDEFGDALDAYPAWLTRHGAQAARRPGAGGDEPRDSADARKARKRDEAERRRQLQPLKKAVERAEARLERLQAEQQALEDELADGALYEAGNKERLAELLRRKAGIDRDVEDGELEWLRAVDALETAGAAAP
ncbi:MAG: ATP-binding cassette domain-containing protein [Gammaproteobacteria bacterium]|nr:ATP-binding cassette domain-containing protein [Gammaproteobacteria bacterium]